MGGRSHCHGIYSLNSGGQLGKYWFFSSVTSASFMFLAGGKTTYLLAKVLSKRDSWTIRTWSHALFKDLRLPCGLFFGAPFILEKAMATHSSTLAWKIPWMEEPGGLQSMGSLRVRHDWATSLSLFTFLHWRRKWQPTPVFLPVESQGRGSLVGCRLWGRTESDTTEVT